MSLRPIPDHFVCDACQERQPLDVLCPETPSICFLLCVRCCACATHRQDDPGGHAVFAPAGERLTWRGLDERARRRPRT